MPTYILLSSLTPEGSQCIRSPRLSGVSTMFGECSKPQSPLYLPIRIRLQTKFFARPSGAASNTARKTAAKGANLDERGAFSLAHRGSDHDGSASRCGGNRGRARFLEREPRWNLRVPYQRRFALYFT